MTERQFREFMQRDFIWLDGFAAALSIDQNESSRSTKELVNKVNSMRKVMNEFFNERKTQTA